MSDYKEKHYSIDAGEGFKMEGCPYSLFEDGHDVVPYLIAPKGYRFVGFKLVELPNNQIYDGKLIAQYEKIPLKSILLTNLWRIIFGAVVVVIIVLIIVLASSISKTPKTTPIRPAVTTDTSRTVMVSIDTLLSDTTILVTDTLPDSIQNAASGVILDLSSQFVALKETTQTDNLDSTFKKEFWTLIHNGSGRMNSYDTLYKKYRKTVSGDEIEYLRFTILKNTASFKEWYKKLKRVPAHELQSVETIDELVKKLNMVKN